MKEMYPAIVNSPLTELATDIDATQTSIEIVDSNALPDAPNIATVGQGEDAETILYTDKTASTLSGITRGFQGVAKTWASGQPVARYFTAYDLDSLIENIKSVSNVSDEAIPNDEKGAVGGVAKQDDFTNHVNNGAAHGIGDKSILLTTNKSTIVGAVNELFTNANNGKSDIASVVGSPALASNTFSQLKTHIQNAKNTMATPLTVANSSALSVLASTLLTRRNSIATAVNNKGVPATNADTLAQLATKIGQISTGKKWAKGTHSVDFGTIVITGLGFKPSYVIVKGLTATEEDAAGGVYGDMIALGSESNLNVELLGVSNSTMGRFEMREDGFAMDLLPRAKPGTWVAFE